MPNDDGRFIELPEGLTSEEERAILTALERYFQQESPKPNTWVLQGRIDATDAAFARKGVPSVHGRGDQR